MGSPLAGAEADPELSLLLEPEVDEYEAVPAPAAERMPNISGV